MSLTCANRIQFPEATEVNLTPNRLDPDPSGWASEVQARVEDPARLLELWETGLLDSPAEAAFDRFSHLASRLAKAPVAAVVLVDKHRQFFKSALGFSEVATRARGTPLSHSFCQHVVAMREPLIIDDARMHPLVWDNPAVQDGVIAYIGVPLMVPSGHVIGSLCVIDNKARAWDELTVESLEELAKMTMTEIALRNNVEEFRSLAEAMPQIVWAAKADGWNTYFNLQWTKYTGLDQGESLLRGWKTALHPDDQSATTQRWKQATETGEAYEIEYRLRRHDGVYHWMLGRALPLRDSNGKIIKWFGTSTDIHEMKLAELEISRSNLALLEAEDKYRSIFENSSEGIFQTTPEGTILSANPALAKMLGFASSDELIKTRNNLAQQGFKEMEDRQEFKRLLDENDRVGGFEYQVVKKDGKCIWVSESTRVVRGPEGQILFYEGSMHDITERKLAEAKLMNLHRQFVDISRQAGMAEVATSVLHNVGNVLNSANISLEVATSRMTDLNAEGLELVVELLKKHEAELPTFLSEHPQGKQVTFYLGQLAIHYDIQQKKILEEFKALRTHIDHISEIVSRQQSYAIGSCLMEPASINEIVADALCMNAPASSSHGVQIVRDLDTRIPSLPLDRHKIMQILVNLIRNAYHAVNDNDPSNRRMIVQTRWENKELLQISVADNGVGIARKNLQRVFEFGFTTRKTGHGFGLHSCGTHAQEMGGTIRVGSAGRGQGAIFTLEIPTPPQNE